MPTCSYAHITRPEQSNWLGPAAPQMYGSPSRLIAACRAWAPTVFAVGMVTFGYWPVCSKMSIACFIAALLTLSIFARMSFFLPSICFSSAFTAAICCCAVCWSRSACST